MTARSAAVFAFFAATLIAGGAFAQSVQVIGTFKDWAAYSASEGAGAVCFAMSKPATVEPNRDRKSVV